MKKVFIFCLLLLICISLQAQKKGKITRYETFIYTNEQLLLPIQMDEEDTRGFGSDLFKNIINPSKMSAVGVISSFVDFGVASLMSLFQKRAEEKKRWEETIKVESSYTETLSTERSINDFYSKTSVKSPMDPLGMQFDGIGCLREEDGDTVFYISCHINRDKLYRIINHSKFELTLDALIIDPYHCNLPNSTFDTVFSYDKHKDLRISLDIALISSWMNIQTMLQKEQILGNFSLKIPISEKDLNENGKLHYVRTEGEPAKYEIEGESFIVPRSYMGYRDTNGKYYDSWGTGEYCVNITLKEDCNFTDNYRKNWSKDYRARKKASQQGKFGENLWKIIKTQVWDNVGKKWVITTLKLPSDLLIEDMSKAMKIEKPNQNKNQN
jgi:hypothetical protein